jgi:hypothetical protein
MRVSLPPGCTGIDFADGRRYNADRRGSVQVADRHADTISKSWYQGSGVIVAREQHHLGTRQGRWCRSCQPARLWNAWNKVCGRCGAATTLEEST